VIAVDAAHAVREALRLPSAPPTSMDPAKIRHVVWDEIADVTGMTVAEFARRSPEWPPDAKIWWDDDHVYIVRETT